MRERALTTGEIAEYCNVTYRAVLKWIESGKLKAHRTPGRHNRVRLSDFLEFLNRYKMPIPDEFQGISPRRKILIVDDEKNIVRAIRRILASRKTYEVDVAYNGFDAGRKFYSFQPDLIILDLRMPGIDGYEVARIVKYQLADKRPKIIAISAYFDEEGTKRILELGVDACLAKPFDSKALLSEIERLLNVR